MGWKPGQSGNPKGRAPRTREDEYLHKMFGAVSPSKWAKACKAMLGLALRGDVKAFTALAKYLLPRADEKTETATPDERAAEMRQAIKDIFEQMDKATPGLR